MNDVSWYPLTTVTVPITGAAVTTRCSRELHDAEIGAVRHGDLRHVARLALLEAELLAGEQRTHADHIARLEPQTGRTVLVGRRPLLTAQPHGVVHEQRALREVHVLYLRGTRRAIRIPNTELLNDNDWCGIESNGREELNID